MPFRVVNRTSIFIPGLSEDIDGSHNLVAISDQLFAVMLNFEKKHCICGDMHIHTFVALTISLDLFIDLLGFAYLQEVNKYHLFLAWVEWLNYIVDFTVFNSSLKLIPTCLWTKGFNVLISRFAIYYSFVLQCFNVILVIHVCAKLMLYF